MNIHEPHKYRSSRPHQTSQFASEVELRPVGQGEILKFLKDVVPDSS